MVEATTNWEYFSSVLNKGIPISLIYLMVTPMFVFFLGWFVGYSEGKRDRKNKKNENLENVIL